MGKHRLWITAKKTDPNRVVLKCRHCPRYIELRRESLYAILVERSRMLIENTNPELVTMWSVCGSYAFPRSVWVQNEYVI